MEADLVSNLRSWFGQMDNPLLRRQGYCELPQVNYFFFAERPLFGVTLVYGSRREVLPVDRMYAGISRYPDMTDDLAPLIPHPSSLIPHPSSLIPHPSSLIPRV